MQTLSKKELEEILATKDSKYISNAIKSFKELEYNLFPIIHNYILYTDRSQILEVSDALFNNKEIMKEESSKKYINESKIFIYMNLLNNEWLKEAKQFEIYIDKSSKQMQYIYNTCYEAYQSGILKTVLYIEKNYPPNKNQTLEDVLYKIAGNHKNPIEMIKHFESTKELTSSAISNGIDLCVTLKNTALLSYLLELPNNGVSLKEKENYLQNNINTRKNEIEIMDVLTHHLFSDKNYKLPHHIYAFIKSADEKLIEYIDMAYLHNELDKKLPNLEYKKSKKL